MSYQTEEQVLAENKFKGLTHESCSYFKDEMCHYWQTHMTANATACAVYCPKRQEKQMTLFNEEQEE